MKFYLFIACLALSFSANAQSGFYLKPSIGIGLSNIPQNPIFAADARMLPCIGAGLDLGYQINNFRLQTGLRYMQTGRKLVFNATPAPGAMPTVQVAYTTWKIGHLVMPVMAGYTVNISNKFSIVPAAGVLLAYHVGETTKIGFENGEKTTETNLYLQESGVGKPATFGVFATGELGFQFNLSSGISLHATPSFNTLLTNMVPSLVTAPFGFSVKPYSFMLNLGIVKDL